MLKIIKNLLKNLINCASALKKKRCFCFIQFSYHCIQIIDCLFQRFFSFFWIYQIFCVSSIHKNNYLIVFYSSKSCDQNYYIPIQFIFSTKRQYINVYYRKQCYMSRQNTNLSVSTWKNQFFYFIIVNNIFRCKNAYHQTHKNIKNFY